ncbi:hypothetical protein BBP40_000780 [Aspergillus hancockii]|nr:hypothetical protein BBP40_000780 [Aspergillus hancockii]
MRLRQRAEGCAWSCTNPSHSYTLGRIAQHDVTITRFRSCMNGTNAAASAAGQTRSTFAHTRHFAMVRIGGRVSNFAHIRLIDVVVSPPTPTSSGVVLKALTCAFHLMLIFYNALGWVVVSHWPWVFVLLP